MSDSPRLTLTRRRALGAAAWTAPAVIVSSAAPAYASSATAQLLQDIFSVTGVDYDGAQAGNLEIPMRVRNLNLGAPTLTGVVQTLEISSDIVTGALTDLSGTGWSHTHTVQSGGSWFFTFVYAPALEGGTPSSLAQFKLPVVPGATGIVRAWLTATHPDATPVFTLAGTTL